MDLSGDSISKLLSPTVVCITGSYSSTALGAPLIIGTSFFERLALAFFRTGLPKYPCDSLTRRITEYICWAENVLDVLGLTTADVNIPAHIIFRIDSIHNCKVAYSLFYWRITIYAHCLQ